MPDVIIVGGGVIGLSIAYELSTRGKSVLLLEQGQVGQESSWAGAGMLPPGSLSVAHTPEARLRGLSAGLWEDFSWNLKEQTGIDNGFRRCGSLCLGTDLDRDRLKTEISHWRHEQVSVQELDAEGLQEFEPLLHPDWDHGYCLPDAAQVRNPRHIQALLTACLEQGLHIAPGTQVCGLIREGGRVTAVETPFGKVSGDQFIICNGAWAGQFLPRQFSDKVFVRPVRGQVVLLQKIPLDVTHLIELGKRYLVPREGGRLLVGSTEEHVGFEKRNTAAAVSELLNFAYHMVPSLAEATVEQTWSGLRPASADNLPYLGAIPETENLFIAAGHFRNGLQQSLATARLMTQLLCGEQPEIPLEPYSCDYHVRQQYQEPPR